MGFGTNDARSQCWPGDCGTLARPTLEGCSFFQAYAAFVRELRTLGRRSWRTFWLRRRPPRIFISSPPPIMGDTAGLGPETIAVINELYPKLIPMIARALGVEYINV